MHKRFSALAAASAAAVCCAHAQVPVTRTEAIVVTATRFEEPVSARPVNVTVISADDIRNSPARTVPDLLAEQAGIVVRDLFGNNAASTTVDLRGFGANGGQNTLVLVDGRRVNDVDLSGVQWSAIPLASIDRIEVVRGGGSVLYGDGAVAGVINIITKSPAARGNTLALRGSAGSYDSREGVVEGSLTRGAFGINALASHFESNGYRDNNQNRQTNALADLRWTGARGDLALKLGHDDQGIRLPGARLVQPSIGLNELANNRRGAGTPFDWAQREGHRATLDWRGRFALGEFNLGAGWRDKEQKSFFAFGGFPDYRETEVDVWSLTPRVKIDTPIAGFRNALVVGADVYRWDYRLRRSNLAGNIGQPFNTIDADQDNLAAYFFNTTNVTDSLSVSTGYRRERLKIDATDTFDAAAPGGAFGSGAPAGSQKTYQKAWEIGARYQLTAPIALLAKTARSFRFANVDEVYESGPAFTNQFQFLRPQTARSYDLGADFRQGTLTGRATAFVIDVNDEIRLDPYSTGVGNRNLPPSRRRGFELDGSFRPLSQLFVGAAYTFIDAKFREGVLPGSVFSLQNVDISGNRVPLVPRHKATLRAAWEFSPATRLNALVSYVSSQLLDNDEANTLGVRIPSYTLVDLKLVHTRGPWTFATAVNNLLGEKYYNYGVRSQFVLDRYAAYPLPERSAKVSAEYRF